MEMVVCPFEYKEIKQAVSGQFSFPCAISYLRLFSKPNFPKAMFFSCFLSFVLSSLKSEMTGWSKLLEVLSGLCGWARCQHSYQNSGDFKLTGDKGFRECLASLGLWAPGNSSLSIPNNQKIVPRWLQSVAIVHVPIIFKGMKGMGDIIEGKVFLALLLG